MLKEVRLGKVMNSTNYAKIANDSDNQSLLILGRSGSGKTYALKKIEENIVSENGFVLVLNFHGTHSDLSENPNIKWIDAAKDGVPLSLLSPIIRPDQSKEEEIDILDAVVDIFCDVSDLKVRQKGALRRAVKRVMYQGNVGNNEIWAIGDELLRAHDDVSDGVYERYYDLFSKGKVYTGNKLLETGKITVIDLDKYGQQTQKILTEMVLSILWRYFRVWGQRAKKTLFIVCDEFQALTLGKDSVFARILREGRKFNLAFLLATQTLTGLERGDRVVLQQAATKIYFRPVQAEVEDILKDLNTGKDDEFRKIISSLRKGECVAAGRFRIGEATVERPIRMKF